MYSYYKIEKNQIRESSEEDYNWLVVKHGNEEEKKELLTLFDLPEDIFIGSDEPEEVSRLEHLRDTKLNNPFLYTLIDLSSNHQERIEKRLEPVTFILSKGLMITYVSRE